MEHHSQRRYAYSHRPTPTGKACKQSSNMILYFTCTVCVYKNPTYICTAHTCIILKRHCQAQIVCVQRLVQRQLGHTGLPTYDDHMRGWLVERNVQHTCCSFMFILRCTNTPFHICLVFPRNKNEWRYQMQNKMGDSGAAETLTAASLRIVHHSYPMWFSQFFCKSIFVYFVFVSQRKPHCKFRNEPLSRNMQKYNIICGALQ